MRNNIFVITACLVLVSACGTSNGSTGASGQVVRQKALESSKVSDKFFDQFKYEVQGSCNDPGHLLFREAYSWSMAILDTKKDDQPVTAELSVQLMDDQSYFASYIEVATIKGIPNSGNWEGYEIFKKRVSGTYKIEGDTIYLSDLGYGRATTNLFRESEKPAQAIEFHITKALNDPSITSKILILGGSSTNVPANEVSINQFCGIKE